MTAENVEKLLGVKVMDQLVYLPYGSVKKAEGAQTFKISSTTVEDIEDFVPDRSVTLMDKTFDAYINGALSEEKKIVAIYLSKEDEKISLVYKLIASNEELRKVISFSSFFNPPSKLLTPFGMSMQDLPRIGGLMPSITQKGKEVQHPAFLYPSANPTYLELLEFFKAVIIFILVVLL